MGVRQRKEGLVRRIALALASLALLAPAATVVAADTITITPTEGPPGTDVTIELQADHELGDAEYFINFERHIDDPEAFAAVAPFSFDENGFARVTFTVPAVERGFYELVMNCTGECSPVFRADESPGVGFTVPAAEASGTIVGRLILQGEVAREDGFAIVLAAEGVLEPEQIVCGPGTIFFGFPDCTVGSYEIELGQPVGTTVYYEFRRFISETPESARPQPGFCRGTIEVTESTQTVTCVYQYPGAPVLPDTSMPQPLPGASSEP
jgi:hypothetical protein